MVPLLKVHSETQQIPHHPVRPAHCVHGSAVRFAVPDQGYNFLKQERHLLISTMEDGRSHTVGVSDAVLDQDVNSTVDLVRNHATPAGETLLAPVAPIPDIPGISAIGVQAQEIIASILGDPAPGLAEVRHRLRKCLADHPGYPERALLAHLMQTSEQANSEAGEARPYA